MCPDSCFMCKKPCGLAILNKFVILDKTPRKEVRNMRPYERLIKYAAINTASDERSESHPSTRCQFDLARLLVEELAELGLEDARVDENCYVYASLPATAGLEHKPALGFIAHMDTSSDAVGAGVRPMIHENYQGGDLALPGGTLLSAEKFPFLSKLIGETLITSDGSTLLGADDKAGIAEIICAVETLCTQKLPHGRLCLAFTPDEEIGRGAADFDLKAFGADFAYTVDGDDVGCIEYENFNAAAAVVEIQGFSVHPGSSKDKMINAVNVGLEFHAALPERERPEYTEGYEGFYHLTDFVGDVSAARLDYILRDHDIEKLNEKKANMSRAAAALNEKYGAGTVRLSLKDQYLNMIEKIKPHFHLVETARKATGLAGLVPEEVPIRGGTDGAVLSWMGLPCPNLGTGGFNFHGNAECITAERMDKATEIILNIIKLYAE